MVLILTNFYYRYITIFSKPVSKISIYLYFSSGRGCKSKKVATPQNTLNLMQMKYTKNAIKYLNIELK